VITTGALIKLADEIGSCTRWLARRLASISPTLGVDPLTLDQLVHDPQWGMFSNLVFLIFACGLMRGVAIEYAKDPLVILTKVKAGTAVMLMNGADEIQSQFASVTYPLLILHGGADSICTS
jgi:hypothetical protein